MDFRIADTFTVSLGRLTGDEQKAVKTTAFDLQVNPATPGHQFHKLDKARDKNFWSVRVSSDIRLIVHRTSSSLLLAYVDHHDAAYDWAERRRLEAHPQTGAAQLVEIRERVQEVVIPKYVEQATTKPALFAAAPTDDLLACGVPLDWLADVRTVTEDSLLVLADRLPAEAAEALLDLATGVVPKALRADPLEERRARDFIAADIAKEPEAQAADAIPEAVMLADAFQHPDAQRRFRTVESREELERALEYPWDRWTVFLHPAQAESVRRMYGGPARIAGAAGTGKTIVALHRAVFLAKEHPDARVLLTTFSNSLASALRTRLRRLVGNSPMLAERIDVAPLSAVARRLFERNFGKARVASTDWISTTSKEALESSGVSISLAFVIAEWDQVVDAWQIDSWESYRDVVRLGRKKRLPEKQRASLWTVFERVRAALAQEGLTTSASMLTRLARELAPDKPPFDYVVVDEAQDISVPELRFIAALGAGRPDALFLAGDLGQRIFQMPFSWKSLGVDVRGRSRTLRVNYRTSHQIRLQADRLLGQEIADVDGNVEDRRGAMSVFNGPSPTVETFDSVEAERDAVARWLRERSEEGYRPDELGVIVRSPDQIERARSIVEAADLPVKVLDETVETTSGIASICTMHLAKGLEFRAVAVVACDEDVLPLKSRLDGAGEESDLEEAYNTERQLLYVACTRARDQLFVSGVRPESEFLGDLKG